MAVKRSGRRATASPWMRGSNSWFGSSTTSISAGPSAGRGRPALGACRRVAINAHRWEFRRRSRLSPCRGRKRRWTGLTGEASEEIGLGHAHGEIAAVIRDENLDRKLVVVDGLQLLNIYLEAAVSGHADDALARCGRRPRRSRPADRIPWTRSRNWRSGAGLVRICIT